MTLNVLFLTQALMYPAGILWTDFFVATAVATLVWRIWWAPRVILEENLITVVNPLSIEEIRPDTITRLDTKWVLRIHHSGTTTTVWVAPASGKRRWIGGKVQDWNLPNTKSEPTHGDFKPHSSSLNSDSGLLAFKIRSTYGLLEEN